jgi:hypothetical protein
MAVSEIKNPFLRRTILVIAAPFLVLLVAVIGAADGAYREAVDMMPFLRSAWRGY